ncbi:MAG: YraN family protein [Oceanospirillaceae bacterium]|jgi:putative endonuclease|nr:YraN family protein [Oceanospirillaceae bacterium]MBT7445580.1 YraN family protein [Methylococcales bacterium]
MARTTGFAAEHQAVKYLKQHGLSLICSNYSCKMGEIDAIMQDDKTLVFVEVKARSSEQHGHPAEYVTTAKQRKIIKTAQHFLMTQPQYQHFACRFDVVCIQLNTENAALWIEDAFQVNH